MGWFSKTAEVEPVEFVEIPEDKVETFWKLNDRFKATSSSEDKYRLWSFIQKVLPETEFRYCTIDDSFILRPRIAMKITSKITSNQPVCRLCGR